VHLPAPDVQGHVVDHAGHRTVRLGISDGQVLDVQQQRRWRGRIRLGVDDGVTIRPHGFGGRRRGRGRCGGTAAAARPGALFEFVAQGVGEQGERDACYDDG